MSFAPRAVHTSRPPEGGRPSTRSRRNVLTLHLASDRDTLVHPEQDHQPTT
ncbi:MAG TPA: hypothetical protein VG010_05095 [Solirubrobacteraceae bacterium]|jgi:hypothetical protein|nr:hypothetical protein [Solirubrobacteraceae bacterium]